VLYPTPLELELAEASRGTKEESEKEPGVGAHLLDGSTLSRLLRLDNLGDLLVVLAYTRRRQDQGKKERM
jgi:hypothetical protein